MAKKRADILQQKQAKLQELTAIADDALNVVTSTISGLELINQEIDDTIADIDAYQTQMMSVRGKLEQNKVHNAKIIDNFTKLLS